MTYFNTIDEAVNWVTARHNLKKGFEHFRSYMQSHGQAIQQLKIIHVAGTNGKGSTCNFLCDCLMAAGYRVGMFTSPHLIKHQDRITINHQWISDDDFLELCNQRVALWQSWELGMFEIDVDLMAQYFVQKRVDYAIVETGLGGRHDATNVIEQPLASVIVSIGLDHMERLGNTKAEIAREKAGIIKCGCPCINGEKDEAAYAVIEAESIMRKTDLHTIQEPEILFDYPVTMQYRGMKAVLSTLAKYQIHNASCAVETLLVLRERQKLKISEKQIIQGLEASQWKGRFQTLNDHPLTIADGAHNEHGIRALIESIQHLPAPRVIVFAALKDKEFKEMIQHLSDSAEKMIITTFDFYRAADLNRLNVLDGLQMEENWQKAIEKAEVYAGENGTVIITGSLYFISEVVNWDRFHSKKA